jgi:hypothetical protein
VTVGGARAAAAAVFFTMAVFAAGPVAGEDPSGNWAAPRARRNLSTCIEDDAVPTPPDYLGWDRSGMVAWKAVEQYGGIVPDIEEDRTQAPPAWWRYPSPVRSAALLAAEAQNPRGLYARVASADLKPGDVLVRASGAGACGKMAVVAGVMHDKVMTVEAGEGDDQATREANPVFFADGKTLRPEVSAYRVRVKKDDTLGHARELDRDLAHLERTVAERPPLLAKNGRAVVDQKVHELLDEAWSLIADPTYDLERRALAGRALALAAALDWPGAAESAAAVLDDVLKRAPTRADAVLARTSVMILAGQPDKAVTLAEAATSIPGVPPRARYLLARALLAAGKGGEALGALRLYLEDEPADPRAQKLLSTSGLRPRLAPPPPADAAVRWTATADHAGAVSAPYDFRVQWPIPWRVVGQSVTPENGLLIDLATGRVLMNDGETERGGATVLAQRPSSPAERAALVRKAGKNMFPDAKLKTLPPLIPGSRREAFRDHKQGIATEGEVTTLERGGVIYFLVAKAPPPAYAKLKDEYALFVQSLRPAGAP